MSYAGFVSRRKELWDRFEASIAAGRGHERLSYDELEAVARDYRRVLQDYAWARERFPETGVSRRLTRLALSGQAWLQRGDRGQGFSLTRFWFVRFPGAVRAHAGLIGICVALFGLAALLGYGVAVIEPAVAIGLLGPDVVDNLEAGQLWTESLTSTVPPGVSSSRISTNNMSVAISAWAGGAVGGIGALWIVLFNGYFLGCVFGATARFSMAGELLEFVIAHGFLEITLILVCAGAGLGLGRALLVAADRPRRLVVREAVLDALVVMLGCLPFFLALGFIEAVISPSPDLGWPVKLGVGLALESAFLMLVLTSGEREVDP